ncbi:MAG TPA: NAD(P)H-dependent glycerol-3-phosphate dehydrogenase [Thermoleophilaceae bacterium]|nr:NAD(P)H-dependent glycerol-3-phosphate dehydrogenase [Thermoleophilaceae bacterium]
MSQQVAVIGAGSWGTTVASLAAAQAPTILWARRAEVAEEVAARHTNSRYLGEAPLHPALRATADLEEATAAADVLIVGIPSHGFRETLADLAPWVRPGAPVIGLSKGLEPKTRMRMSEIVADELPGHPAGVLTGPNLAKEVLAGQSAAAVVAMPDEPTALDLQRLLSSDLFKLYRSTDVVGAEIAGALKNVFAIAAGIASGLGTGDNTRALVMCRAIAEMTRLGVAMGGDPMTFAGLAGIGDLLATCISPLSRNRTVGEQLAAGRSIAEITASMRQVAEGIKAAGSVVQLADLHAVEMPIAGEVDAVVNHGRAPRDAFRNLLERVPTTEFHGVAL